MVNYVVSSIFFLLCIKIVYCVGDVDFMYDFVCFYRMEDYLKESWLVFFIKIIVDFLCIIFECVLLI